MPRRLRWPLATLLAIAAVARAQEPPLPDPQAFLAESFPKLRSNDLAVVNYTFREKETRYSYGPDGKVTRAQVRIYEVTPSPEPDLTYHRLVSVDGVATGDLARQDAEQKQEEREWLARREQRGLSALQARQQKLEIEERKEQAVVRELPSIFVFRMLRRELIDGRPAIVFAFDPRPKYEPRTMQGRLARNFRGEAWIDEQDHELVRLTAEALDTISVKFGFVVRLLKGSHGLVERRKIGGEAWLPTYTRFTASGRVLFVARVDLDVESEYSDYRKMNPGDEPGPVPAHGGSQASTGGHGGRRERTAHVAPRD